MRVLLFCAVLLWASPAQAQNLAPPWARVQIGVQDEDGRPQPASETHPVPVTGSVTGVVSGTVTCTPSGTQTVDGTLTCEPGTDPLAVEPEPGSEWACYPATPGTAPAHEVVTIPASVLTWIDAGTRRQIQLASDSGDWLCYRWTTESGTACDPSVGSTEPCDILDSGTASSVGVGFLYDVTQTWALNADPRLYLIDSAHASFAVTSYVDDTVLLTNPDLPDEGAYQIVQAIVDYDTYTPAASAAGEVDAPVAVVACPGATPDWHIYDVADERSFAVTGCDDSGVVVVFSHDGVASTIAGDVYFYTVLVDSVSTVVAVGSLSDYAQTWVVGDWIGKQLVDSTGTAYTVTANDVSSLTLDTLATPAEGAYDIVESEVQMICVNSDVTILQPGETHLYDRPSGAKGVLMIAPAAGDLRVTRGDGLYQPVRGQVTVLDSTGKVVPLELDALNKLPVSPAVYTPSQVQGQTTCLYEGATLQCSLSGASYALLGEGLYRLVLQGAAARVAEVPDNTSPLAADTGLPLGANMREIVRIPAGGSWVACRGPIEAKACYTRLETE